MSQENSDKNRTELDEEALFETIGDFGPWQRNVFIAFFLINSIVAWQNFSILFLAPNQDFQCFFANNSDNSISDVSPSESAFNISNQCNVITDFSNNQTGIISCSKWEYNKSVYPRTIISEWDLVCGRAWLVSFAKSIYMMGFMAATVFSGQLSDNFGRFPTIMVCWLITCISSILTAFSMSYVMFAILRFWMAFGGTGFIYTGYVLLMEIIGPKRRTELGMLFQTGYVIGLATLPAIAWFVRDWVYLQLVLSAPTLVLVCIYWILPESPRWLMTQRKRKQFEDVVENAAKKNGRELKGNIDNILPFSNIELSNDKTEKMILSDLVRTPQILKKIISSAVLWAVSSFVYYGISYGTNDLSGNPYLNAFLSGVVEFPSVIISFLAIRKYGRKISVFGSMVIGGAACIAILLLPQDENWLILAFAMLGRFCISGTVAILHLYTTEIFPTVIRNQSHGVCTTCGGLGSIASCFERELGNATKSWVPNLLNGSLALCTASFVFILPETKDQKMPDTIEEGERMS